MSPVISSASIAFRPRPKRCGASRLSGRVATSPPAPAAPRGRPWHPAQLSERPAPIPPVILMFPVPSLLLGPWPWARVNLRWKIWRPRRTERKGSRLMMNSEEFGVIRSPRPGPISFASDLLIPALAVFGARLLSTNWARTAGAKNTNTAARVLMLKLWVLILLLLYRTVVNQKYKTLRHLERSKVETSYRTPCRASRLPGYPGESKNRKAK